MITIAAINALASAAADAVLAGDFTTALSKAKAARVMLAVLPDSKGTDNTELKYDRVSMDRLIAQLERDTTASTRNNEPVMQRAKITWKRPSNS